MEEDVYLDIPIDLLREIDELVGEQGREQFILDTMKAAVERHKRLQGLQSDDKSRAGTPEARV